MFYHSADRFEAIFMRSRIQMLQFIEFNQTNMNLAESKTFELRASFHMRIIYFRMESTKLVDLS